MARCPECQTEQSADFGMTTCTQCSAVFMVGIDGEVASAEAPSEDEPAYPSDEAFAEPAVEEPTYQPSIESSDEATTLQPYEPPADDAVEEFAEPVEDVAEDEVEYSENFLDNLSEKKTTTPSAEDPLDIQRFDESAASQMDDGEYVYEVIITGIDSADLKKEIIMALSEKRFSLIVSELQNEIQKGELIVRNLNPVRAMLIVLRLQSLDVIVEWRQKHFTQEAKNKKDEAEI